MTSMTAADLQGLLLRNLPPVDHRGEMVESVGSDGVRLRLPVQDAFLSRDLPPGSGQVLWSGPVMLGLAETAMYACVHAVYGERVLAVTVSMNVSFLRAATAHDLVCEARVLRRGRQLAFTDAVVRNAAPDGAPDPLCGPVCAQVSAQYAVRDLTPA